MSYGRLSQLPLGKRKRPNADDDLNEGLDLDELSIPANGNDGDEDMDRSDSESSSDDEDDDDEGTGECEYFETSEALPQCPAYDKDFSQVGTDLTKLPKQVLSILDASACTSNRVKNCRASAEALLAIPTPKREKICLLGNTGCGKLLLIHFEGSPLTLYRQELVAELPPRLT
jgi:hypothetical protein